MMLSKAAILLSLAAGYVVAEECTIVKPSTIYGFATPSASASVVPTACDRFVNGLCVVEDAAPEGQALAARAVTIVDTIDGVSSIDVCIETYCTPDEECQSVGFDDSGAETICYIYGEPLDFDELEVAIDFIVAFVSGGELYHSSTTSATPTSTEQSSTETSAATTTTEESSSTTEASMTSSEESTSSTETPTSTTSSEESSTTEFSSSSSSESSSTESSSTTEIAPVL